jgi:hypothetical protein
VLGILGGDAIYLKNVTANSIDAGDFLFSDGEGDSISLQLDPTRPRVTEPTAKLRVRGLDAPVGRYCAPFRAPIPHHRCVGQVSRPHEGSASAPDAPVSGDQLSENPDRAAGPHCGAWAPAEIPVAFSIRMAHASAPILLS